MTNVNELRRLRHMQAEITIVLVTIIVALVWRNTTAMFVVLCVNAFFWAIMLQEVGRDLASRRPVITKPPNRGARMKQ